MKTTLFVSAICLAFGCSAANADMIPVDLQASNFVVPFGPTYGTVLIDDEDGTTGGPGIVTITLDTVRAADAFQEFGFNTSIADKTSFDVSVTASFGGSAVTWVDGGGGNLDGFGVFDFSVVKGMGDGNRADHVVVKITFDDTSDANAVASSFYFANSKHHAFAAHFIPTDNSGLTGWIGDGPNEIPGVSEPASVLLFGFGALGMFGLRLRKRRQTGPNA